MRNNDLIKTVVIILLFMLKINVSSQDFSKEILSDNYCGKKAEFGDFDRDGDLDILLYYTIDDNSLSAYCKILESVDTGFIERDFGFPSFEKVGIWFYNSINFVDFNNDGWLDVFTLEGKFSSIEVKLFKNNRDKTFIEDSKLEIDAKMSSYKPSWADYDNDGDLDLAFFAFIDNIGWSIKLYEYKSESNKLVEVDFDFGSSIIKSNSPWADFNKDGYIDLLVSEPASNCQSNIAIYKNNGDKTFSKLLYDDLVGLNNYVQDWEGDMRWGDYNNDGFIDILIAGENTCSSGEGTIAWFKNEGDESFSLMTMDSAFKLRGKVWIEWGDYDNNGYIDLLQYGDIQINDITITDRTQIAYNHNGVFSNQYTNVFLDSHQEGIATNGDYNNDNMLDILILGNVNYTHPQIALYKNTSQNLNTPPASPTNLSISLIDDEIQFSWDFATDFETPQKALSYNIYVILDGDTIVSSNSLPNGKRMIVGMGNAYQNNHFKLKAKAGEYKWSVQTIDNNFVGSSFADEQKFVSTFSSINSSYSDLIKVYPNPVSHQIVISGDNFKDACSIYIYDVLGKLMFKSEVNELPVNINFADFNVGHYILKLDSKRVSLIKQIIKN